MSGRAADYAGLLASVQRPQARDARGRLRTCQEKVTKMEQYCDAPATVLIDTGDEHPYWMCGACAAHNLVDRGGRMMVAPS